MQLKPNDYVAKITLGEASSIMGESQWSHKVEAPFNCLNGLPKYSFLRV